MQKKVATGNISETQKKEWPHFKEIPNNWLGYSVGANAGHGLGANFSDGAVIGLRDPLKDFGKEKYSKGSHLERLFLFSKGAGKDALTLEIGEYRQQPDFHVQLSFAGHVFNVVFEIDNGMEPLDSRREHSIRTKITGYETYQDWVTRLWKEFGEEGRRPGFRVVFLTTGMKRVNHILWLAKELARNPDRRF